MASLNLREAAEQTGTSKADIWCAIRAGRLAAKKTDDGGFAIDPDELFYRVELGDRAERIERLRERLYGSPARLRPRLGRMIDRRARTEQALRRALIAERSALKRFDPDT